MSIWEGRSCKVCGVAIKKISGEKRRTAYCSDKCAQQHIRSNKNPNPKRCRACGKPTKGSVACSLVCMRSSYKSNRAGKKYFVLEHTYGEAEREPGGYDPSFWQAVWTGLGEGDFLPRAQSEPSAGVLEDPENDVMVEPSPIMRAALDGDSPTKLYKSRWNTEALLEGDPIQKLTYTERGTYQGETVEQYLARGGKITTTAAGISLGNKEGAVLAIEEAFGYAEDDYSFQSLEPGKRVEYYQERERQWRNQARHGQPRNRDRYAVRGNSKA